ncbi:MAG: DUF4215 domain-containing protein [Patescibacteria group bacterium]
MSKLNLQKMKLTNQPLFWLIFIIIVIGLVLLFTIDVFGITGRQTRILAGGYCGDGNVDTGLGEQCDDGNRIIGDGCDNCQITGGGYCGDGNLDAGEECDDGNTNNNDGCADCRRQTPGCVIRCGNGEVTPPEECDDGNLTNGDGCSSTCQNERPSQCEYPVCSDIKDCEKCNSYDACRWGTQIGVCLFMDKCEPPLVESINGCVPCGGVERCEPGSCPSGYSCCLASSGVSECVLGFDCGGFIPCGDGPPCMAATEECCMTATMGPTCIPKGAHCEKSGPGSPIFWRWN